MSRFVLVVTAVAALIAPHGAHAADAPDKATCLASYEGGQRLRMRGSLREAREALVTCTNDACPVALRGDCATWLKEVEDATPSIVLAARGADGEDIDASAIIDGLEERRIVRLDVKPIELDPGPHTIVFEREGRQATQSIILREGEKARVVVGSFSAGRQPLPAPPPPAVAKEHGLPRAFYPAAGMAAIGFAGFATFGTWGYLQEKDRLEACSPDCASGDVSSVRSKYVAGDIALGVGVIAAAVAVYLWATR